MAYPLLQFYLSPEEIFGEVYMTRRHSTISDTPRVPPTAGDLQVNACKNPSCSNFGIQAKASSARGRPRKDGSTVRDQYILVGQADESVLRCKVCGRSSSIKNNEAIASEIRRISAYLETRTEPCCPVATCANSDKGVYAFPENYQRNGFKNGAQRYRCKSCRALFTSNEKATRRQRKPHLNRVVFAEIVSKKPIRGIMEVTGLSADAVYDKIEFLYHQCVGFAGEREARLSKIEMRRAVLCVDRQDYIVNWQTRNSRKNVQMTSICTVESLSNYVVAHNLNFDPDTNQVDVDDNARMNGDLEPSKRPHFRAQPQYWLSDEFAKSAARAPTELRVDLDAEPLTVEQLIREKARLERKLVDPEKPDTPARGNQLPPDGVLTHLDYTSYAHARLVRRLMHGARKKTIYMDQDEVLRAAYISAFTAGIAMGDVDLAYIQFQKQMTIDEKRDAVQSSESLVNAIVVASGETKPLALARYMGEKYLEVRGAVPDWRKRWIDHPQNTLNEPWRKILYLSDTGNKSLNRIGWTLSSATLAPVDNYFMRLRRKINYLERPLPTRSNANRLWSGYHAYNPLRVMQMLEIFRVYTNFIRKDSRGQTPAMKIGLARGAIRFEDVIYWQPPR